MIWRCPHCHGPLTAGATARATCDSCGAQYESVAGILDLRTAGPSWIDAEQDREAALRLAHDSAGWTAEQMVRHVFRSQPGRTEEVIATRTRQVLESPDRLRAEFRGWLAPVLGRDLFLDLGCGPGALLAAAAAEGQQGIGIDVSMVWLVVAQRLIAERGGRAILAAATAEALPLAADSVPAVVSLDVIEHVGDPTEYLREIDRVTGTQGYIALSTPNRYSLTAEPHVGVWGVGWLPRRYQAAYVKWRTKKSYDYCQLLSADELVRLVRRHTRFRPRVLVPAIPQNEIDAFPAGRARLARMYNRLAAWGGMGGLFRKIGPFFQVVGTKATRERN